MTRDYRIIALDPTTGAETGRSFHATSLSEAIAMAERVDAGKHAYIYGITAEDYAEADALGIAYNVADGLLI